MFKPIVYYYPHTNKNTPCAVSLFVVGIAYLIDPDSYASWSFYTPLRASQARQVEG